jgi:hypothetical protein
MGKLGLNLQPSTLAHQAWVAAGAELASSVCVIQPSRPGDGTCFGGEERDDRFGVGFFADRFDGGRVFFFMAIQGWRSMDGSREAAAHDWSANRNTRRSRTQPVKGRILREDHPRWKHHALRDGQCGADANHEIPTQAPYLDAAKRRRV